MLETLIKRNGEREAFDYIKQHRWATWGGKGMEGRLDWPSAVKLARDTAPEEMSTQDWQLHLIKTLVARGSQPDGWPYMVLAGKFYAVWMMKDIHGDDYPSLKEHLKTVQGLGLARDMGYQDDEIDFLDKFVIDHERNLNMAYHQVEQYRQKYSLIHRVTKKAYETPQFTMMRMAMAVYSGKQPVVRLDQVKELYLALTEDLLNPPTPNYSSLGTDHYGMASCCLIAAADDAESIQAAGNVAYGMTLASAGLGIHLATRAPSDPVDGGRVAHAGRLNYVRKFLADCSANKQGMRGGALNVYDTVYNEEIELMGNLQNARTPIEVRERRVNVTYQTNAMFLRLAAQHKPYFTFNCWSAPDLHEAFFDADESKFEALYAKYEADPNFKKNYRDAYDTLVMLMSHEVEDSTLFWNDPVLMNQHTPFRDVVRQSNLCVAPETYILTDAGAVQISTVENKYVNVWNGQQFSKVQVLKTGVNQPLITVAANNGVELDVTPMHKFYIQENGTEIEVRAKDLKPGMTLVDWDMPQKKAEETRPTMVKSTKSLDLAIHALMMLQLEGRRARIFSYPGEWHVVAGGPTLAVKITAVTDKKRVSDTFCFKEPLRNRGVFNGLFTGQCMEVMVPTTPFMKVLDLYGDGDPEKGEVGICNIASIPQHNFPFDPRNPHLGYKEYKRGVRAAMEIIDYAIDNSDYRFPAIKRQAQARRNASVGMSAVATLWAQLGLKFNTPEGRRAWHILCERHAFACAEVALEMGIEKGNAEWMHRTKWPDGWLVIDTYKKTIDTVVDHTLCFDWENLRGRIVANKGIRFSCLVAHMPGEQATRKGDGSNSIYPLFKTSVDLSDGSATIPWAAKDNDLIGDDYQLVSELSFEDVAIYYGICQKFTDQGGSFDDYIDRSVQANVNADTLVKRAITRRKYGQKSKYYTRSLTEQGGRQKDVQLRAVITHPDPAVVDIINQAIAQQDDGLGDMSGPVCTLDGNCGA